MSTALVSVIIPCYRQGHFLAGAIESALRQTYSAVEVIVVDDGSDDCTEEVARSFGKRLLYLRRENGGPAAARNTGLDAANGKYLLFLDADDLLHPEAIVWLVDAARGRDDVLCTFGIRDVEHDGVLTCGPERFAPTTALGQNLLLENFNPPLAFLCSRAALLAEGGFDPSPWVNACEDWEMWIRLVFAGTQIVSVPRVGGYYRQHPTSHSRNRVRMAHSRVEVMSRTLRRVRADPAGIAHLVPEPNRLARTVRALIGREHLELGYHLREEGSYFHAIRHYALGLWVGGSIVEALSGICKLLPHRLLRAFIVNR